MGGVGMQLCIGTAAADGGGQQAAWMVVWGGAGVGEGEVGLSVPTSSTWVRVVASAESGSAEGTD